MDYPITDEENTFDKNSLLLKENKNLIVKLKNLTTKLSEKEKEIDDLKGTSLSQNKEQPI